MKFSKIKAVAIGLILASLASPTIYASSDESVECAVEVRSRLWELLVGDEETSGEDERVYLIPGGQVFGTKIKQAHPSVTDAGECEGLSVGDVILSIDNKDVNSLSDVKKALARSEGVARLEVMRGKDTVDLRVALKDVGGEYKLGCTLRECAAGIGTVTYIDPGTGEFGGLGHGIYDTGCDVPIEITGGIATGVILGSIERGESGKAGELSGILTEKELGTIDTNCEVGVFGRFKSVDKSAETLPVAHRCEVTEGAAEIISTLRNGKRLHYDIEIQDIDHSSTGTKSFKIKVTDPALLAISGGIVRGMSGSTIIQNGKIVGAVTHVMINDPTMGYGIFIENMLNAARNQVQPKAA